MGVLIVAALLQCTALAATVLAANVGSNFLPTKYRISPFLSEGATESLMQYKRGNWLFSFQRKDLEVLVTTENYLHQEM